MIASVAASARRVLNRKARRAGCSPSQFPAGCYDGIRLCSVGCSFCHWITARSNGVLRAHAAFRFLVLGTLTQGHSMSFQKLGLCEPVLRAVAAEGYAEPTPIQSQAIPHLLAGRDLLGCAQTGTGKTAAFSLPILHRLWTAKQEFVKAHGGKPAGKRPLQALILCPTRELAVQIGESLATYGRYTGL